MLSTALRRGELLNCTWTDVAFAEQTLEGAPESDTKTTCKWRIEDTFHDPRKTAISARNRCQWVRGVTSPKMETGKQP